MMPLFTGPGNCARKKNDNVAMEANKETLTKLLCPALVCSHSRLSTDLFMYKRTENTVWIHNIFWHEK